MDNSKENMIHIFYRTTLNNKPNNLRPTWFSYEKCFKNLLDSLNLNCQLTIMFDGSLLEYDSSFIKKYQSLNQFRVISITAGSDLNSNVQTFEFIKKQDYIKENDLIYILENDYLHLNGWVDCILDLYSLTDGMHYTTLFDHNDKYLCLNNVDGEWGMYKNLVSRIYVTRTRHWRTLPNTCASFIMSKKLFDEDYDILSLKEADNTRFDILTRTKNRIVLSPIPGLSTHVQHPWMSPCINWEQVSDNTQLL
jgi:hypothetical protein